MSNGHKAPPRITVVTPSLNQAQFLEETMRSVLDQEYPNLEYIVIDGGSTDGSVDIIRRHESRLAYWVSEPDAGQSHAINKGFQRSTGEIMGWINSDDVLTPWCLKIVGEIYSQKEQHVQWITGLPAGMLEDGRVTGIGAPRGYNRRLLRLGLYEGSKFGWVQQEGTFWTRSLWERAGARLNEGLHRSMDFELWVRFAAFTHLYTVPTMFGIFRHHPGQLAQTSGAEGFRADLNGPLKGLASSWKRRLIPVRLLRRLERAGLPLSRDFVRYDHARKEWLATR